jgi:hypothetical protein
MRRSTLATAGVLVLATPAAAEEWDFVLINMTGKAIRSVELAPTRTADWVPNQVDLEIATPAPVRPTARTTIHFDKRDDTCVYDIRATLDSGSQSVWQAVNVCDNSYVTLKFNASGATTFSAN